MKFLVIRNPRTRRAQSDRKAGGNLDSHSMPRGQLQCKTPASQRHENTPIRVSCGAAEEVPAFNCILPIQVLASRSIKERKVRSWASAMRTPSHRLAIRRNSAGCCEATSLGSSGDNDRGPDDVSHRHGF